MSLINDKHHQAMDFTDSAMLARRTGNTAQAAALFRQAFECEREAADLTVDALDAEPTRSVLHRSAATLALDCGDYRAAERLIARALTGNPPDEIADELRELLQQVYIAWGYPQRSPAAA